MVLLAETTIEPLEAVDELQDLVEIYLGDLGKNGQVWGEPLVTRIDGAVHVACTIPRADALADEHSSKYVRQSLGKALAAAASEPVWVVRGTSSRTRNTQQAWLECSSFYVQTDLFDRSSPLVAGDTGEPVPLYLLPLDPSLREGLMFWMHAYAAFDLIWLNSRALEMPAYFELSEHDSVFSQHGRSIVADVERALGRPVYYYLKTYYVRHPSAVEESCPSCNAPWRVGESKRMRGLQALAFRCERCRLIADPGVDSSNVPESDPG